MINMSLKRYQRLGSVAGSFVLLQAGADPDRAHDFRTAVRDQNGAGLHLRPAFAREQKR